MLRRAALPIPTIDRHGRKCDFVSALQQLIHEFYGVQSLASHSISSLSGRFEECANAHVWLCGMNDSLTSMHIRAGRAAVGWSIQDLAEKIDAHRNTVSNFENGRTEDPDILSRMKAALEAAGVEFLYGPKPGVRLVNVRSSSGK
ncbi:MAG: hypothetical protein C0456_03570 [Hyphomonas sp.]|nr:hypothetical protein [Hyphomonas sp.]